MEARIIPKGVVRAAKIAVFGIPMFVGGVTFTLLTHGLWERDSNGCPIPPWWMKKGAKWLFGPSRSA